MKFKILEYKRYQKDGKGNTVLDLTNTSIDKNVFVSDADYFLVSSRYVMRPDLISVYAYGTDEYADLIMKYNGISNPFSINEGDFIVIPKRDDLDKALKIAENEVEPETKTIADFVIQPKSNVDKSRLEALKKKAENKNILPPNINDDNEENIVFTPDKIILGSSVTGCGPNASRAKTKMALMKKYGNL